MQQGAVGCNPPTTPEVTPAGTLRNCKKSEPHLSCGDSSQPTIPKTYKECVNDESGLFPAENERLATFQIGEQCLTGIIFQKTSTSERSQTRQKSATFPKENKERAPVDGRIQTFSRPKSHDCTLPGVVRSVSPSEANKPTDTINTMETLWNSSYGQNTSFWLPDVRATSKKSIGFSECGHTAKQKFMAPLADMDHTCSAVCADDPACDTCHKMVDTIVSEMPFSNEKNTVSSTISTVHHASHVLPTAFIASQPEAGTSMRFPCYNKLPNYSVGSALFMAFRNSISPILYNTEDISVLKILANGDVKGATDLRTFTQERNGYSIPLHIPTRRPTVTGLSSTLPTSTAVVIGKPALQYLENNDKESNRTQMTTDQENQVKISLQHGKSITNPRKDLNQTHSGLPPVHIPSTTPILTESMETCSQTEHALMALTYEQRKESALRSLILTTIVPVLGKEADDLVHTEILNANRDTQKHGNESVVTEQPNKCPYVAASLPGTAIKSNRGEILQTTETGNTIVRKPVVGSLMSLANRQHESSTRTALSSLLVKTTAVVLGEEVAETCVELTEIELSDDVPDKTAKVNNRSILDILFCRRRK
ncbi:uncharacterized protein LOC132560155 [Ylistrum balloti]|uniref:uncharacterized protein LOC132560155 n=1 Tax=Ylistrum balloti TaxID=509963 RepID=UPI002905E9A8|nr:uncharacterized protein LOC132560155 [Ylistrum balloti]